jgi:hypothetical protein
MPIKAAEILGKTAQPQLRSLRAKRL